MLWSLCHSRNSQDVILDGLIHPRTLVFRSRQQELGFLSTCKEEFNRNLTIGGAAIVFLALLQLLTIVADSATSGGAFEKSNRFPPWAIIRATCFAVGGLLAASGIVLALVKRLQQLLGLAGCEKLVCGLIGAGIIVAIFMTPWYSARLAGADPHEVVPNRSYHDDARMLLATDMLVSCAHLALPVRSVVMWVVPVAAVVSYVAATTLFGGPHSVRDTTMNVVLITLLSIFAFIGRQSMERKQRSAYVTVAKERTLRVQAEHQLHHHSMQQNGLPQSASTAEAESVAETQITNTTENVFGFSSASSPERKTGSDAKGLEQIAQLGIKEHWLIPMEQLKPDGSKNCVLGCGGFGLVFRARYHGALVAVKAPLRTDSCHKGLASTAQELRMLRRMKHPHIVSFYGSVVGPNGTDLWLVLEFVSGTELHNLVGPNNTPGPNYAVRLQLAQEVCFALTYLHAQWPPVVHGDVKPNNVLVESLGMEMRAKLTDFGLSKLMTRNVQPLGGTRMWVAPEVLLGSVAPAPSSDVFSFGRLLYMTMNAQLPSEYISSSMVGEPDITADATVRGFKTQTMRWMFESCTGLDPKQRPTMQRISDHFLSLGLEQSEPQQCPVGQSFQDTVAAARLAAQGKVAPVDATSTMDVEFGPEYDSTRSERSVCV